MKRLVTWGRVGVSALYYLVAIQRNVKRTLEDS
jgi:hypothetical protein